MNNEEKILGLLGQLLERMDKSDAAIAGMHTEMNERFEQVHAEMNERFEQVHAEMNERFEQVHAEMNERFEQVHTEMDGLHAEMDGLHTEVNDMHTEMGERFDRLEFSVKLAWQDIAGNERLIRKHEREFHNVI